MILAAFPAAFAPAFLAALLVAFLAASLSGSAAAGEQIVVDWHTGLAIGGFDPVAFFTDGKPLAGSPQIELRYGGAVWRFVNVGNREEFAAHPDVYMPQYGGYDPVGVARGVAVPGNPNVFAVSGERLFLFYDEAKRGDFTADPARVIASANRKWPDLMHTLAP
jgi:hypothetical protein